MVKKSSGLERLVAEQRGCWVIGFTDADVAGGSKVQPWQSWGVSALLPQSPSQLSLSGGVFHTLSPSETSPCTKMEPVW